MPGYQGFVPADRADRPPSGVARCPPALKGVRSPKLEEQHLSRSARAVSGYVPIDRADRPPSGTHLNRSPEHKAFHKLGYSGFQPRAKFEVGRATYGGSGTGGYTPRSGSPRSDAWRCDESPRIGNSPTQGDFLMAAKTRKQSAAAAREHARSSSPAPSSRLPGYSGHLPGSSNHVGGRARDTRYLTVSSSEYGQL